ncbi:MAG: KH domain-containing protein [Nanoarchaeota archaeon]
MAEVVLIPNDRRPILIGKNGSIKKRIEKLTNTKITVREDVEIEGDIFDVAKAKDIITAIARGFSPERAFILLNENFELKIITLKGQTDKTIKRLMARVIGRKGSTRRIIELETGAKISIYGKTVSIIGELKKLEAAQEAVEAILAGRKHGTAYKRMLRKVKD